MADRITVLLVDDHSLVRRGFRRMLEDEPEMQVVGEASDGMEAVQQAQLLKPRVIVMDCALPEMNGLQATRKILEFAPQTLILMLTMHTEDTWVARAAVSRAPPPGAAARLPIYRRHRRGGTPLPSQQRRLRRQTASGTPRSRLRFHRLRRRRLAGHSAGEQHGLARPQPPAIHAQ